MVVCPRAELPGSACCLEALDWPDVEALGTSACRLVVLGGTLGWRRVLWCVRSGDLLCSLATSLEEDESLEEEGVRLRCLLCLRACREALARFLYFLLLLRLSSTESEEEEDLEDEELRRERFLALCDESCFLDCLGVCRLVRVMSDLAALF